MPTHTNSMAAIPSSARASTPAVSPTSIPEAGPDVPPSDPGTDQHDRDLRHLWEEVRRTQPPAETVRQPLPRTHPRFQRD
jgi:hypothetical protein